MYRKFDVTGNLLFAQYFFFRSKHSPGEARPSSLCKIFQPDDSTIFVLFGKYCPIMDQLGSKDSSRDF
jgi:hypothetical protein